LPVAVLEVREAEEVIVDSVEVDDEESLLLDVDWLVDDGVQFEVDEAARGYS
jgi:hypothetical protein